MNERGLPLFLSSANKLLFGAIWITVAVFLYVSSNRIHLFPPQYLQLRWTDRAIPMLPWTVWIYISEYVLFITVYLVSKDMENTNKYLYSFIGLQGASVLIFWLWPTTYPRDLFPLTPSMTNPLTYFAFNTLRNADTPANCCPSLHVSSVYLSSFIFLKEQKEKFKFFFGWATLIALSTLTTKQHYVIDVTTGLAMGFSFYYIFHRWIPYRKTAMATTRTDNRQLQTY